MFRCAKARFAATLFGNRIGSRDARRAARRQLVFDALESRRVLSAQGVLEAPVELAAPRTVFAPDTPAAYVDAYQHREHEETIRPQPLASGWDAVGEFGAFTFSDSNRWSGTSSDGSSLGQGDPTTLAWSIVPDGTAVDGFNGEPDSPSDLRQYLSSLYGSFESGLSIFSTMFQRWDALTGIDFVHEPQDDGSPWTGGYIASGETGVRGDIRIAGHTIDGPGGVLAYNFYPDAGDMVLDTADLAPGGYLSDTSNDSLRLRNTLAHEVGHGLGIEHVVPVETTKLMEPYISTAYDGPQFDDVLAAHRGYGDQYETTGGDTAAGAIALGAVSTGPLSIGADATDARVLASDTDFLSIDDNSDVDFLRVSVDAGQEVRFELSPVGPLYDTGSSSSTVSSFDAQSQSDLNLALFGTDGNTVLDYADATALGGSETLRYTFTTSGDYYLRVAGAHNAAQFYQLSAVATDSIIVIDSEDASRVQLQGAWYDSTAVAGYHGAGYKHNANSQLGTSSVTFSQDISTSGTYDVALRWTSHDNRASNAPVTVVSKAGSETFSVDQTRGGATWRSLGSFEFDTQSGAAVTIADAGADGYVIADAIRLIPLEQNGPPTASLVSPASGAEVTTTQINDAAYLEVTYRSHSEAAIDGASIIDSAAEFELIGAAADGVTVDGAGQLVSGTTYRYPFSGTFAAGEVSARFAADTFADDAGRGNEQASESFAVLSSLPENLLVDSEDADAVTLTGDWYDSTSVEGFHGSGYRHDGNTSASKAVTFQPTVASPGHYEVYGLWTSHANRASNVPVEIAYSGGSETVVVNQRLGGGRWNLLGTFPFDAGSGGTITMRSDGTNGYVVADAIRLVSTDPHASPVAKLADPAQGASVDVSAFNAAGYIDVTFESYGGNSLDTATITDAAAELQLSGSAASGVVVDGAAQWISGTTYRYPFSGDFLAGEVSVTFSADTFADASGRGNQEVSETFSVVQPVEITLESEDASAASRTGAWYASTAVGGFHGTGYLHDADITGGKAVAFRASIAETTEYEVYATWTSHQNRASQVPIDIRHSGGTDTVVVDQTQGGSRWNRLGTFAFDAGSTAEVTIRNDGTDGYVIADAIRLVKQQAASSAPDALHSSLDLAAPLGLRSADGNPATTSPARLGQAAESHETLKATAAGERAETAGARLPADATQPARHPWHGALASELAAARELSQATDRDAEQDVSERMLWTLELIDQAFAAFD